MNIVSFFAGAGGLDLGFQRAGFNVVWANEYDKDIWETYEKNHPHTILDRRSIVDIPADEVPECDGIIGGPPCQSFSLAGKRKKFDKKDDLFSHYLEVIKVLQPKYFVMENVKGILTKEQGKIKDIILKEINSIIDLKEIPKLISFLKSLKATKSATYPGAIPAIRSSL